MFMYCSVILFCQVFLVVVDFSGIVKKVVDAYSQKGSELFIVLEFLFVIIQTKKNHP